MVKICAGGMRHGQLNVVFKEFEAKVMNTCVLMTAKSVFLCRLPEHGWDESSIEMLIQVSHICRAVCDILLSLIAAPMATYLFQHL